MSQLKPHCIFSQVGAGLVELMVALLLVAMVSLALVKARVDSGARTQAAQYRTSALNLAQEITVRLRLTLDNAVAAAETGDHWETISGCDKPCEVEAESALPLVARINIALPESGLCLSGNGETFQVTVFWRDEKDRACEAGDRVELRAPVAAL